jgi:hypothetical protein
MPKPPQDLFVAASVDRTIASELAKAAAFFETLGAVATAQALSAQARELDGHVTRLHAQSAEAKGSPEPTADDNGPSHWTLPP